MPRSSSASDPLALGVATASSSRRFRPCRDLLGGRPCRDQGNFGRFEADVEYQWEDATFQKTGKLLDGIEVVRSGPVPASSTLVHAQLTPFSLDWPTCGSRRRPGRSIPDFQFRTDLVLKAEHHWNEGYFLDGGGQNVFAPAPKTKYGILSLSTNF